MGSKKGSWRGECFTPGCEERAYALAIAEPRLSEDHLSRYRCRTCLDLVSTKVYRLYDEHASAEYGTRHGAPEFGTPEREALDAEIKRVLDMSADELHGEPVGCWNGRCVATICDGMRHIDADGEGWEEPKPLN